MSSPKLYQRLSYTWLRAIILAGGPDPEVQRRLKGRRKSLLLARMLAVPCGISFGMSGEMSTTPVSALLSLQQVWLGLTTGQFL